MLSACTSPILGAPASRHCDSAGERLLPDDVLKSRDLWSLKAARFAFIMARTPSFEGRRFADEYPGKICLIPSQIQPSCSKMNDLIPIPPYQELLNTLLLVKIFKIVHHTVIECLSICGDIGSRKDGRWTEREPDLGLTMRISFKERVSNLKKGNLLELQYTQ